MTTRTFLFSATLFSGTLLVSCGTSPSSVPAAEAADEATGAAKQMVCERWEFAIFNFDEDETCRFRYATGSEEVGTYAGPCTLQDGWEPIAFHYEASGSLIDARHCLA